jgi:hypothetical protein
MDNQQNAMTVFAEELGEVAVELLDLQKQLFKAIRFGIDEQRDLPTSNRERIQSEWQDLLGSMFKLEAHGINLMPNALAIQNKINKISKYEAYSESLGTIRQQLTKPADDTISVSKGEWEAISKDAERYKHLRDSMFYKDTQFGEPWMACEVDGHNLDQTIDAAIQGTSNG